MQLPDIPTGGANSSKTWPHFIRGFLAQPGQVASVMPSSRELQRRISSLPCVASAQTLVELGPGTGETTRALLGRMSATAQLLCIEIVPEFVALLEQIPDPRLAVVHGSAHDLEELLPSNLPSPPEVIVSGVPFSHMSPTEGDELVRAIYAALAPGGTFVAYQFRDRVRRFADECFGEPETSFVLRNVPPLWVYQWKKPLVAADASQPDHERLRR